MSERQQSKDEAQAVSAEAAQVDESTENNV